MDWKRGVRSLRLPVKTLEGVSWRGAVGWLVTLGVGLWLLSWLDPQVAEQKTIREHPMSLFQFTALVTMVAASFLGSSVVGLLTVLPRKARRCGRALAGFAAALPVGLYVTERLREGGLEYHAAPAVVGAAFCGLAAVFLYPDPFAANQSQVEPSATERC